MNDANASYTVYGGRYSRTGLVLLVLDAAGLAYTRVDVDTVAGEHRTPAFREINPAGYVPALRTPEGDVLHETPAIMLYLCERHGLDDLAPPPGARERGEFLAGVFYCADDIQPELKRLYFPERFATSDDAHQAVQAMAQKALIDRFSVIDRRLEASGPYYLGERFSLIDWTIAFWATTFQPLATLWEACPAVAEHARRIKSMHDPNAHIEQHERASAEFWLTELHRTPAAPRHEP